MGRVQEAFPFQRVFNRLSTRLSDARASEDILIEGQREYFASYSSAMEELVVGSSVAHQIAVNEMLLLRPDLRIRAAKMNVPQRIYSESLMDPVLAAVDRTRERVVRSVRSQFFEFMTH